MATTGKCISCGAGLDTGGKHRVVCPYCGTTNIIDSKPPRPGVVICAQCGEENPQGAEHCKDCGADLYYTCPRCGTRNTADAVHCIKCGVHLADEIRNWRIEQAQKQARLEVERAQSRARTRHFFISLAIIVSVIIVFVIMISAKNQREQEAWERSYHATGTVEARYSTATAVAEYENYPYKWVSDDGLFEFRVRPSIKTSDGELYFISLATNDSTGRCGIQRNLIYAVDDAGRVYQNMYASNNNSVTYVEPNGDVSDMATFLTPTLNANATKLTVIFPNSCGYSNIRVTLDLTSPLIDFW